MHIHEYKLKTPEELQLIDSLFLISSLSYSKVSQFQRNQKAFEMLYVYGYRQKNSSTTVAGQAYHYALEMYFKNKKEGVELSIVDLETLAFNYIDEQPASEWKIQKTTPTIEECKLKANDVSVKLIGNFFREIGVYLDEIEEIIEVELFFSEFLTINGVDIPIKFNGKIDLIIKTKTGKTVGIDHKSKATYTDEKELVLTSGKQSCIYVKAYESMKGVLLDEFWFAENKHSTNKDKSPQIQISKIEITKDVLKLYEAYLYTPLKALLKAVSDPDYDYLINDADNFVDIAEIYAFDAKTRLGEIDADFNIEDTKLDLIEKRTKKIKDASATAINPTVIKTFIKNASKFIQYNMDDKTPEQKIEHVLRSFGTQAEVFKTFNGFSSVTYLLEFGAGVKIASVQKYKLDLANQLNVSNVRIPNKLTVYEDKAYLSIETSKKRDRDLIWDKKNVVDMKIPIGKDNYDKLLYWDLENETTANVLISGSVGSGKSAEIISFIESALVIKKVTRIVIFDPKWEMKRFASNKKVEVYNEIIDIEERMNELVEEMNERIKAGIKEYTMVVIDEYADILSASRKGKALEVWEDVEVGTYKLSAAAILAGATPQPKYQKQKTGELKSFEENFMRLSQKGRSSGTRIVAATQRASAKIVSGDIKINYPVQICFRLPKEADSRVILDESGAESLSGMGDGLVRSSVYPDIIRFQAFYKPD